MDTLPHFLHSFGFAAILVGPFVVIRSTTVAFFLALALVCVVVAFLVPISPFVSVCLREISQLTVDHWPFLTTAHLLNARLKARLATKSQRGSRPAGDVRCVPHLFPRAFRVVRFVQVLCHVRLICYHPTVVARDRLCRKPVWPECPCPRWPAICVERAAVKFLLSSPLIGRLGARIGWRRSRTVPLAGGTKAWNATFR